jgi:hypothetical protein
MNSTASDNTQSLINTDATSPSKSSELVNSRQWSTEQDGPNDKTVDIWWNGKWVPAYFKDIKKGDFFLMIGLDLEPGRCFLAKSNAKKCGVFGGNQTYIVNDGMEVVQAPAIVEINPVHTLPQAIQLLERNQHDSTE